MIEIHGNSDFFINKFSPNRAMLKINVFERKDGILPGKQMEFYKEKNYGF